MRERWSKASKFFLLPRVVTLLENGPKVPAAVAVGTDAMARTEPREGNWYWDNAQTGANTAA